MSSMTPTEASFVSTLSFMQASRHMHLTGTSMSDAVQTEINARQAALTDTFREQATGLTQRQNEAETRLHPLVERVANTQITKADEMALQGSKKCLAALRQTNGELHGALSASKTALQDQQKRVAALSNGLGLLQQQLKEVPPKHEALLLKAGGASAEWLAEYTQRGQS